MHSEFIVSYWFSLQKFNKTWVCFSQSFMAIFKALRGEAREERQYLKTINSLQLCQIILIHTYVHLDEYSAHLLCC